jgi:hydrogenase maturation protein HypF
MTTPGPASMPRRIRLSVSGVVQGVGFRPFVYGLASRLGLAGFVRNEPQGVELELEGAAATIEAFLEQLRTAGPPLARIQGIRTCELPPLDERGFVIHPSAKTGERTVFIAPDQATCQDCLRELRDPRDRRYRYPFINCTNCGPRYTIIRDVPYDRARTTMAEFIMCPTCRAEYEDPSNRRFHAEPTCCPACGPQVRLTDPSGIPIPCDDAIAAAIDRLSTGTIVAVKGLGGFHLACDASDARSVRRLRQRKHRDLKPFALMMRNVAAVERICDLSCEARDVLASGERPILLLRKRRNHGIAEEVAPRSACFGVMLPYTPLHELLLEGPFPALVMTSGNLTDEPIAFTNEDALNRLGALADYFLLHNRAIHIRTDDSVARMSLGKQRFLRRSRGYAPFPVELPVDTTGHEILSVGPELNNTICVTRGNQAFLSHHIGDLQNVAAYDSFLQAVRHLENVLAVAPKAVVCDFHPAYASTRYARECGLPLVPVQHHHAHVASVLAEVGRCDKVIGVSFDGMGWGNDGTLWGGEFMVCDLAGFERVGHLKPIAQPGGDAAAKRPPRMAYAYLREAFGERADELARELLPGLGSAETNVVAQLINRRVNCPMTSSMGRLFDAASALLGICDQNTYHAQAPMELEARACEAENEEGYYPARTEEGPSGTIIVPASHIVRGLVEDRMEGTPVEVCAARFHNSIARVTVEVCEELRDRTKLSSVALSGGVFANAFLLERLAPFLEAKGFEVLLNALVPAGDGGVSLGQAAVAAWRFKCA